MTVKAIVEKIDEGRYRASIEEPFPMECEGSSEEEALKLLRESALARIQSRKEVDLELPGADDDNPWLRLAGMFKGHPDFDQYLRNIEEHRREMDALEPR